MDLLYNNGFGRVYVVNLFCSTENLNQDYTENWKYIKDCIRQSNAVMLFYGKLSKPNNAESNYEEVKSVILKKLANLLKEFKNQGKSLQYYVLLNKNGEMRMPTLSDGVIKERSFDEILKLLGEK